MHPISGGAPVAARPLIHGWLTAVGVSAFGDRMSMFAIPWFVLTTTGSPLLTGVVAAAELAPMVVLKVLGGPVIDRVGAVRVAVICDIGSMLVVGAIPLLHWAGMLNYGLLLTLVALAGALRGPSDTAKETLTPQIAAATGIAMERATGLRNAVFRTAMMLGAAATGGVIVAFGPTRAIAVDAATFGISALLLAWSTAGLRRAHQESQASQELEESQQPECRAGETSYVAQLGEGWRFLRRDRLLIVLATMIALINLLDVAFMTVLMPVWAKEHAGPLLVGFVFAVWNLCSVIGSLATARWGVLWRLSPAIALGLVIGGLPRYAAFAFDTPVVIVFLVAIVGGLSLGVAHPLLGVAEFSRIPEHLTGRVLTLTGAMSLGLMPLSGLLGGGLVEEIGLATTMLVLGISYGVVVVGAMAHPGWRDLDRQRAAEPLPGSDSDGVPAPE